MPVSYTHLDVYKRQDMWFKRPEFDREAAFIAVGGVRGSMPWEEFVKMKLPVPTIEKQLEICLLYTSNGFTEEGRENLYTPEELFCCGYAPYFMEGIKLRYPEYCSCLLYTSRCV